MVKVFPESEKSEEADPFAEPKTKRKTEVYEKVNNPFDNDKFDLMS